MSGYLKPADIFAADHPLKSSQNQLAVPASQQAAPHEHLDWQLEGVAHCRSVCNGASECMDVTGLCLDQARAWFMHDAVS